MGAARGVVLRRELEAADPDLGLVVELLLLQSLAQIKCLRDFRAVYNDFPRFMASFLTFFLWGLVLRVFKKQKQRM